MKTVHALMTAAFAVLPTGAAAQAVQPVTPEESVRLALEQSARVRAADAEADAARAVWFQARAAGLPAVRTQASYMRLGGDIPPAEFTLPGLDTTITFLPVVRDRYHTEVSVDQLLFTGSRVRSEMRAAEYEAEAAALQAEQERADVALEVRQAYWSLFAALAVREAVDASLAQVTEHVAEVQSRVDAGTALAADLLAAQTRRSEVLLERVEADNAVQVNRLELNRLTGRSLDSPVAPAPGPAEPPPVLPPLDEATAYALSQRPSVQALSQQVEAAFARIDAGRSALLPELAFTGRYIYARPNPYVMTEPERFHGTWELGVTLRWSLWEGGRDRARILEAESRAEALAARLADERQRIAVEVARQYLDVQRALEAVEAADRNVAQAEESLRVTRRQFEEGVVLAAQVLDAVQAQQSAQARRAQAVADLAIARAVLLRVMGRVW